MPKSDRQDAHPAEAQGAPAPVPAAKGPAPADQTTQTPAEQASGTATAAAPTRDAAAEARAAARAAARATRDLPATPKGKLAWDKARTRELFSLYKDKGDEAARDELIMSHLNLVRFLASKFKNRGEPLDDLIQVGTIGLIKAIDRFDPSRGLEFTTYATPTILGEIKRHFRDKGWSIRVPRRLQELSAKVNQATDDLQLGAARGRQLRRGGRPRHHRPLRERRREPCRLRRPYDHRGHHPRLFAARARGHPHALR